jgi:hypothetical protein
VVFLDDMQWADAASLQLLTQLATSDQTESLLVIEAYRDSQVDPAHPFAIALREHEKRGATISRIALAPLGLPETVELRHFGSVHPKLQFGRVLGSSMAPLILDRPASFNCRIVSICRDNLILVRLVFFIHTRSSYNGLRRRLTQYLESRQIP